jgi:hypothetical protein
MLFIKKTEAGSKKFAASSKDKREKIASLRSQLTL